MTSGLMRHVQERTPELTDDVVCGGPGDLKGERVVGLDLTPEEVPCPKGDNFNPYREGFGVST